MTVVKSKIIVKKYDYPQEAWLRHIEVAKNNLRGINVPPHQILIEAGRRVLNEKFEEIVNQKTKLEEELGTFIYFDVIIDENRTDFQYCSYQIIFETFQKEEAQKIAIVQNDFVPMINVLSEKKFDEIATKFGVTNRNQLTKDQQTIIKKYYKQEAYAEFYDTILKKAVNNYEVAVSDYALQRWAQISPNNYVFEIKRLAFEARVKLEIGQITDNDVNYMFRFLDVKNTIEKIPYANEDERKEATRQWIVRAVSGKKIVAYLYPELFRKITTSR